MVAPAPLPIVTSLEDVAKHAGGHAVVEGIYEQQDVRMRPVNPAELFRGHVAIVLADDEQVFLYPPGDDEAIRDAAEIERFEHRRVRASGLLLAGNPDEGTAIEAPVLTDVGSIDLA